MKKLIAMLLCLVMIVACFAACSTSGNDGTKGTEAPNKGTEGTKAPDKGTEGTEAPKYEFPASITDGVELGKLPLVPEGTPVEQRTLTIGLPGNVNTENYDTNLMTLYYEEKTGVNLEFMLLDSKDYKTQMNAMIAAEEALPDVLWYTGYGKDLVSQWGNDGVLLDLTPYYAEQAYWFNIAVEEGIKYSGSEEDTKFYLITCGIDPVSGGRYSIPTSDVKNTSGDNAIHIGINKQWLANLKLEYPKTVDELYNVLVAFRDQDPNGNGQKDEIPALYGDGFYRADFTEFIVNAFVFCNDSVFYNVTDGKIWVPYTTDEYRQAMKYLNKLYEEQLLSASCWSIDSNEMKTLLTPADGVNTLGVFGGHGTIVMGDVPSQMEFTPLFPLADETGKGGYAPFDPISPAFQTHVTSSAKDPVLAFRFVDYLLEEEASIVARYGAVIGEYDDMECNWSYAKEGDLTADGAQANIWVKNDNWSKLSNNVWHGGGVRINFGQTAGRSTNEGKSEAQIYRSAYYYQLRDKYLEIGQPEEKITQLIYNAEEQEVYNELFTNVKNLMMQWRAEFISGAKDIDNDAVWKQYVDALNADGLEDLIEVAQSCYTRMMG